MVKSLLLCVMLVVGGAAQAKTDYGFPPVTMDVLKADGRSGTFLCPDERWCYIKALEYEARGGEQYCVSLTMKRDGKVIWYRRYQ